MAYRHLTDHGMTLCSHTLRDIPCSPTPVSPSLDQKVVFRLLVKKSALCNVLNINEALNIQYNNNTQCTDIPCAYSLT